MMLSLARNIPQANSSLKSGQWTRSAITGVEVSNKTLGVIGLGKVGAEVAKRAIGLQMRVLGYDPFVSRDHAKSLGIDLAPLAQIFQESDFICLHTPLTDTTRGLIGEKEISTMKPTARILNTARGELVDEKALLKAVEEGRIAGAALDVFSEEPPTNNPILDNPKIIVTPHLGASTQEAQAAVASALQVLKEFYAKAGEATSLRKTFYHSMKSHLAFLK